MRIFHGAQQSLRGGIVERIGKFADVVAKIVITCVLRSITAARNGTSIGAFEKPAVLVVTLDAKAAFVYQPMVT